MTMIVKIWKQIKTHFSTKSYIICCKTKFAWAGGFIDREKILKEVFLSCNFIFLKKFACAIFMVYSFLIRKFQELVLISIKHPTPAVVQLKCCVFYFTITHLVLLNIYFIIISVPKAAILPQQVLVYSSSKAPEHFSMLSSWKCQVCIYLFLCLVCMD